MCRGTERMGNTVVTYNMVIFTSLPSKGHLHFNSFFLNKLHAHESNEQITEKKPNSKISECGHLVLTVLEQQIIGFVNTSRCASKVSECIFNLL